MGGVVRTMQSLENPLIRPPAAFSPYEGEKGLVRASLNLIEPYLNQILISRHVQNLELDMSYDII